MPTEVDPQNDDAPRSLRFPDVRERRRAMLDLPHIAPLTAYAAELACQAPEAQVPYFDPLDGGIQAKALFLLEKPGPMTAPGSEGKRAGSGFISRNNDDPTAQNIFCFMQQAGLPRKQTVIWNVIPAWNGTVRITPAEHQDGIRHVHELIALLPALSAVVLVGRKAARAQPYLASTGLALFASAHPSPVVRATAPSQWNAIPLEWAKVAAHLASESSSPI